MAVTIKHKPKAPLVTRGPERDEEAHLAETLLTQPIDTTPAVPGTQPRLDESQRMQIRRLYAEKGWTTRQIAAELRMDVQAVRHAITPIAKAHLRALKREAADAARRGAVLHKENGYMAAAIINKRLSQLLKDEATIATLTTGELKDIVQVAEKSAAILKLAEMVAPGSSAGGGASVNFNFTINEVIEKIREVEVFDIGCSKPAALLPDVTDFSRGDNPEGQGGESAQGSSDNKASA